MKRLALRLASAFSLLLLVVAATSPARAVLPEDPPGASRCATLCGGTSCDEPCKAAGIWTTCGQWDGNPANDLDGDGVANNVDNCFCTANSNQADCDTDGIGDACDSVNEKWVQVSTTFNACALDGDEHLYGVSVQIYTGTTYRNVCNNATCVKKNQVGDHTCCHVCAGGGNAHDCCIQNFGLQTVCTQVPYDQCGGPACPF